MQDSPMQIFKVPEHLRRKPPVLIGLIDDSAIMAQSKNQIVNSWNDFAMDYDEVYAILFSDVVFTYPQPFLDPKIFTAKPKSHIARGFEQLVLLLDEYHLGSKDFEVLILTSSVWVMKELADIFDVLEHPISKKKFKVKLYIMTVQTIDNQIINRLEEIFTGSSAMIFPIDEKWVDRDCRSRFAAIKAIVALQYIEVVNTMHHQLSSEIILRNQKYIFTTRPSAYFQYVGTDGQTKRLYPLEVVPQNEIEAITDELYAQYARCITEKKLVNSQILELFQLIEKTWLAIIPKKTLIGRFSKFSINTFEKFQDINDQNPKLRSLHSKQSIFVKSVLPIYGFTMDQYLKARNEFIQLLQSNVINCSESAQEPSTITFMTQKDVLSDSEMVHLLKNGQSQSDAVFICALVGRAVHIKPKGTSDNGDPWQWYIDSVSRQNKIIDSTAIYQNENKQLTLNAGTNIRETLNVVIPLFDQRDSDIAPFLKSTFFDYLMTYNLLKSMDLCYDLSYAVCLAHYLGFLILQPASSWRQEQLEQIRISYLLKYRYHPGLNLKIRMLTSKNPEQAFINDLQPMDVQDPSLITLLLFILLSEQPHAIKANIKRIIQKVLMIKCWAVPDIVKIMSQTVNYKISRNTSRNIISLVVHQLGKQQFEKKRHLYDAIQYEVIKIFELIKPTFRVKYNREFYKIRHSPLSKALLDFQLYYQFFIEVPLEKKLCIHLIHQFSKKLESMHHVLVPAQEIKESQEKQTIWEDDPSTLDFSTIIRSAYRRLQHTVNTTELQFFDPNTDLEIPIVKALVMRCPKVLFPQDLVEYTICIDISCPCFLQMHPNQIQLCNCRLRLPKLCFQIIWDRRTHAPMVIEQIMSIHPLAPIRKFYKHNTLYCQALITSLQQRYKIIE